MAIEALFCTANCLANSHDESDSRLAASEGAEGGADCGIGMASLAATVDEDAD